MSRPALDALVALQRPDGCFASFVTTRAGASVDHNGFVTASVLRMLRHVPDVPGLVPLRRRALDFLESCASARVAGAFAFWPDGLRPAWAGAVPADVDDTAIILAELLRAGRLDRAGVLRRVCHAILPCRVRPGEALMLPPWVAPESFHTWIPAEGDAAATMPRPQVIDCCVNANVAALMARIEARHLPGYDAAVATVLRGLDWAGSDAARLDSLTPFYPSPHSLADALEHAVECGAAALREGLARLRSLVRVGPPADGACCRSAYGHAVWRAPAIEAARALAEASATSTREAPCPS